VDFFAGFGNRRGNENPFLISMEIIWFRWHNYWAEYFEDRNPNWPDQKVLSNFVKQVFPVLNLRWSRRVFCFQVFDVARKWTVATLQKIAMYDWLPEITGMHLPPYNKSGESWHDAMVTIQWILLSTNYNISLIENTALESLQQCKPSSF